MKVEEEVISEESLAYSSYPNASAENSSDTDRDSAQHSYCHTHFRVAKAERQYTTFYHSCKIIIKRRINALDVGNHTPRVWDALDQQGWLSIMEDHQPAVI